MKSYGIYLAYPPDVDLRGEGLGRHLAMFLKGAEKVGDVKFTIVCPSWSKKTLELLFHGEGVDSATFEIRSPEGEPYILRLFQSIRTLKSKGGRFFGIFQKLKALLSDGAGFIWLRLVVGVVSVRGSYSLFMFIGETIFWLILLLPIFALLLPLVLFLGVAGVLKLIVRAKHLLPEWIFLLLRQINELIIKPERNNKILRVFEKMQDVEISRMQGVINGLKEINAWYCPTAFWPEVNEINKPKIICVPDVVVSNFPVEFSRVGGDWAFHSFRKIEQTISDGDFFVTYSETTKWTTLVDRYGVSPERVKVIRHAPNALNSWIDAGGPSPSEKMTKAYCLMLLDEAFARNSQALYIGALDSPEFKYIFYASQVRPNKNIMTLLRAYNYLLKRRFVGVKLFLTGNPASMPEVGNFVRQNGLDRDVVFLQNLTVSELAAAYKMATLAVNPSLSEGGCPFTFSEALSVGTPVVMSRISVAEEVLRNEELQKITFFDPYDWKDCANRIEWGLSHTEELLLIQEKTYAELQERTWADVVGEYVEFLEFVSQKSGS